MANLTAVIGADTSKFVEEVKSAKYMLEKFVKETSKASNTTKANVSVTNEQVQSYQRVINHLQKIASGTMNTTQQSKALKDQIRELKIQWANLSNEARQSDFGKSISNSIETANNQLRTLNKQLSQTSDNHKKGSKHASSFGNSLGSVMTVVKKLAPAIGGAALATKSFSAIINGSQSVGDAFRNTMYSSKNVLSEFASAIATVDFSSFAGGLDNMIKKGREAALAIDQLGNTIMSYQIKSAKANQRLTNARAIISDPNSTKEEVAQAKIDMQSALDELKLSASVMLKDYENAIISEVNARGGSLSGEGALAVLDKWLEINSTDGRDAVKKAAKQGYNTYQKELKKLQSQYTVTYTSQSSAGAFSSSYLNRTPEYLNALSILQDKYKDQISYHVLLEKYTDKELQALGQQRMEMININGQLDSYASTMNRLSTRKAGYQSSNVVGADGSISYLKSQIQDAQKLLDIQVVGTKEWERQSIILENLNRKLSELVLKEKYLLNGSINPNMSPEGVGSHGSTAIPNKIEGFNIPVYFVISKSSSERLIEDLNNITNKMNVYGGVSSSVVGSINSVYDSFSNLSNKLEESKNGWESFVAVFESSLSVFQGVANILQAISTITEVLNAAKKTSLQLSNAETVATQASSAAKAVEAGANISSAAAAGANAAAKGASSVASVPFLGPALAVAAIAAIMAGIVSAISSAKGFTNGGIITGASSIGDYNIAKVNSGEMILNGKQQKRLFNILNTGNTQISNSVVPVEFKLKGTELIGLMNNVNHKKSKI